MSSRDTLANYFKKVTTLNSFKYSETVLLSPGLFNVLAKYASTYRPVIPFRISLQERKIYLVECSLSKRSIILFSPAQMLVYTFISVLLLIKNLIYTRQEASDDMSGTLRTLAMFYLSFILPVAIPGSVMIAFRGGIVC